ncbi:MAG: DUF1631 family protein [Lysobacter sp.]
MSYFDDPVRAATAADTPALPPRVRSLLTQLQDLAGKELERELERLLDTLETDLFRQAQQSRNSGTQSGYLASLSTLRTNRHNLVKRFATEFATALGSLRAPLLIVDEPPTGIDFGDLRLVDHSEVTETNVLTSIALRHESRAGLPLLLLGQRFGVLAGQPAFDATRLPVSPVALATMLSRACAGMTGDVETRLQLYHLFDRQLMAGYLTLVEAMNALLDGGNVLPGLTFVPTQTRRRPGARSGAGTMSDSEALEESAPADASSGATGRSGGSLGSRQTTGSGPAFTPTAGRVDTAAEQQALAQLQQLLAARRPLPLSGGAAGDTPPREMADGIRASLATAELDSALSSLQAHRDGGAPRTPSQVREALLERSQQELGRVTSLSHQDDEVFELLGLLYSEIGRELRQGTRGADLLERLQVPLLRVALQDRGFFVRQQHPARKLLNAIAEAGTQWLDEGDGDADPRLDAQLREAVDHVVDHYDGDTGVFDSAHQALTGQLDALSRKAEVAQRRQVEAARGRDKLERAKLQAASSIQTAIGDAPLPKFLATLLEQAWTDVLSLVLLRHGEDSPEWRDHLEATTRIIAANRGEPAAQSLQPSIEDALGLVGYQGEEATAIARRLVAANDDSDDAATRTELVVKLKARTRLGAEETPPLSTPLARNAREEECYTHLRSLPFGTTIEFTTNQQGDSVRRRLAWFSPVTGRALLLNQKGQRIDDPHGRESLDQIARLLAIDEARIVRTAEPGSLIDRAWQATLGRLRSFGSGDSPRETTP